MAPTIFIKFCGFIVHSNTNNMTLSAFPRKILVATKNFLIFQPSPNVVLIQLINLVQIVYVRIFSNYLNFRPTLKIEDSSHEKLETNWVTNMEFYKHDQLFLLLVVLSVIWNLLLIEINLFEIRILDIKRENVCAVCPYLLFFFFSSFDILYKVVKYEWDWIFLPV